MFRAIDFLKPNGLCSLLVKSGVLLKFSPVSNAFKEQLLESSALQEVINFSHVRYVFFSGAISPFILLKLEKRSPFPGDSMLYWSLRKSESIEKNKVVIVDKNDLQQIPYSYSRVHDIWKILYWGNQNDFKLLQSIRRFMPLSNELDFNSTGQGFQEANESKQPCTWLSNYLEIPVEFFDNKYSSFKLNSYSDRQKLVPPPVDVKLTGKPEFFSGKRILVRKGVVQRTIIPKGQVIVRLETETFSFRHSVICLKLKTNSTFSYEFLIGILWSSILRYYLFMTSSRWGIWYEEINKIEVLGFPVPVPNEKQKLQIEGIVRRLRESNEQTAKELQTSNPLLSEREIHTLINESSEIKLLEAELDQSVFELYQLTEFERQLVEDRCRFDIDLFYNKEKGLANQRTDEEFIDRYFKSFNRHWSKSLEEDEFFEPQIILSEDKSMLGILFHLRSKLDQGIPESQANQTLDDFKSLLKSELSSNIYTDGLLRRVSEETIFIVKRNLKGHWTQSEAIVDAEATLLQAIAD